MQWLITSGTKQSWRGRQERRGGNCQLHVKRQALVSLVWHNVHTSRPGCNTYICPSKPWQFMHYIMCLTEQLMDMRLGLSCCPVIGIKCMLPLATSRTRVHPRRAWDWSRTSAGSASTARAARSSHSNGPGLSHGADWDWTATTSLIITLYFSPPPLLLFSTKIIQPILCCFIKVHNLNISPYH